MEQLHQRVRKYSGTILRFCRTLPRDRETDLLARQLLGAGTSPNAHFREALRARSKAEYASKVTGGLMELEEALSWLELIKDDGIKPPSEIVPMEKETRELIAIFLSQISKWKPRK